MSIRLRPFTKESRENPSRSLPYRRKRKEEKRTSDRTRYSAGYCRKKLVGLLKEKKPSDFPRAFYNQIFNFTILLFRDRKKLLRSGLPRRVFSLPPKCPSTWDEWQDSRAERPYSSPHKEEWKYRTFLSLRNDL